MWKCFSKLLRNISVLTADIDIWLIHTFLFLTGDLSSSSYVRKSQISFSSPPQTYSKDQTVLFIGYERREGGGAGQFWNSKDTWYTNLLTNTWYTNLYKVSQKMPTTTGPVQIHCRQHRPNTSNRRTQFDQNLPVLCFIVMSQSL